MLRGPFTFDVASHTYRVAGRIVPGLSSVLVASGLSDDSYYRRAVEARERGSAVHEAALRLDLGDEPADRDLRPEWLGYFEGYRQFSASVKTRWRELEQARLHRAHGYAARPDRMGTLNGTPTVLEIKTGGPALWHQYQTAGQALLWPKLTLRRGVVYLPGDGTGRFRVHDDPQDFLVFLDALRRVKEAEAWKVDQDHW